MTIKLDSFEKNRKTTFIPSKLIISKFNRDKAYTFFFYFILRDVMMLRKTNVLHSVFLPSRYFFPSIISHCPAV